MWLGVDPLWEKYAGMNPYNYCAGNPVMLVDVDGREARKSHASNKYMGTMSRECRRSFVRSKGKLQTYKGDNSNNKTTLFNFPEFVLDNQSSNERQTTQGSIKNKCIVTFGQIIDREFDYCGVSNSQIQNDIAVFVSSNIVNCTDVSYQIVTSNEDETTLNNAVTEGINSTGYSNDVVNTEYINMDSGSTRIELSDGEIETKIYVRLTIEP